MAASDEVILQDMLKEGTKWTDKLIAWSDTAAEHHPHCVHSTGYPIAASCCCDDLWKAARILKALRPTSELEETT